MKSDVIISATLRKTFVYIPLALWFFVSFIAVCLFTPSDNKVAYPAVKLLIFLIYPTLIFTTLGVLMYLKRQRLIIGTNSLKYVNLFNKTTKEYRLDDIVDFKWCHLPYTTRTATQNGVKLNNDLFYLFFKNGSEILVPREEFENFEEIRNHLYAYCMKRKVI